MTSERHTAAKFTVVLTLGVFALSVLGLLVGRGTLVTQQAEPSGPQFVVRCTAAGASSNFDIGPVTCTLKVSGLPAPLQNDLSVTLLTTGDTDDVASGSAPSATVVSADVPHTAFDTPLFVSREVSAAPPRLLSNLPQVPEQPPKSL